MVVNIRKRLESLRIINLKKRSVINKDLFKLFCTEEFFSLVQKDYDFAEVGCKQERGLRIIKELITELQNQQFEFGVDDLFEKDSIRKRRKDMLVHNGILCIIQCIYPSIFQRYKYESHQAVVNKIKESWTEVTWGIGINIKNSFKNMDHCVLISILRIKIQDECFIQLIWKLLSHERRLENGKLHKHECSVVLKIFNHIYLSEFDAFMKKLMNHYNLSYFLIKLLSCSKSGKRVYRLFVIRNRYDLKIKSILPRPKVSSRYSRLPENFTNFNKNRQILLINIKFIRYLDRVLIGISGSKLFGQLILYKIEQYLVNKLKLFLVLDKNRIQNLLTEKVSFLGYDFKVSKSAHSQIQLVVPMNNVIQKLVTEGFSNSLGCGIRKKGWIRYSDKIIIKKYSLVSKRLRKYLLLASNYLRSMKRVQYILKYSCAHTLAAKHRTNLSIQLNHLNLKGIFS